MKRYGPSLIALVLLLLSGPTHARCAPGTTCFELCPEVELETSYNTAGKALRYLFNGSGSWIFATDLDLRQDFTFSPAALEGLAKLKRLFDHYGTTVVIVYTPPRALMHPDKVRYPGYSSAQALQSYLAANEQLRRLGYVVPDFGKLIPDKTGLFFQRRDHHWSTFGSQKSARLVADTIMQLPLYPQLKKQEFVTELKGIVKKYGTLSTVASRICGMSLPNQYVQLYTTLPKGEPGGNDEAALFGETPSTAEVALIGTSFSKGKLDYNFAGFMEEYLSVSIDNRAIRGGGYNGALEQIILDGMFSTRPPRLLIWELPGQFTMDSDPFYRLIAAELSGGCKSASLLSGKGAVSDAESDPLANANAGVVLPLVSRNHLLKFKFNDPSVFNFFLNLTYMSGHHEKLKVERHPYVKHDGTFYFELPDNGRFAQDTLFSVGLRLPQPTEKKIDVEVQVCERNVI
ncbi:MAG: alginate O-acetyltransferase AlgX-related protein [Pseudomonadota bacterium]